MADFEYLSRNRYFDLYSGEEGRKRLNSLRLIQALHKDLLAWGKNGLEVTPGKDRQNYEIKFQGRHLNQVFIRRSTLDANEYRFLRGISDLSSLFLEAEKRL